MSVTVKIALLHPGAMGASVGRCALAAGHAVGWLSEGRSTATQTRAEAAGLRAYTNLENLLSQADWVVAVCPPEHALATATSIAARGFKGLYLDANAVAPATATRIAETVSAAGASYVDGGLIGPPVTQAGSTRLYVSGTRAGEVVANLENSALAVIDLGIAPSAASSLKMCYAAWTKGSSALLLAVAALARSTGVANALQAEWACSLPEIGARLTRETSANAPKAWRFVAEMEEIAQTFADNGLPGDFHIAAAAIYHRLADFKDGAMAAQADAVLSALLASTASK